MQITSSSVSWLGAPGCARFRRQEAARKNRRKLTEKLISQSGNAASFLGPENGGKIRTVAYDVNSRCLQKTSLFLGREMWLWLAAGLWWPSPRSAQLWLQAVARPAPRARRRKWFASPVFGFKNGSISKTCFISRFRGFHVLPVL